MKEILQPAVFRRRAINALRSMEKREPETKPDPKACPKCGKVYPKGLHLHMRACK